MITTTLNKIKKHFPYCQDTEDGERWLKLLNYLEKKEADDEPLPILIILESNGLDDALYALRAVDGFDREIRLFICWCACQSLNLFEAKYPDDRRIRQAIKTAAMFAEGLANKNDMDTVRAAAMDAARIAAMDAAKAAERYEKDLRDAWCIWDAAWSSIWATQDDMISMLDERNARVISMDAMWDEKDTRDAQEKEFIKLCKLGKEYMPKLGI